MVTSLIAVGVLHSSQIFPGLLLAITALPGIHWIVKNIWNPMGLAVNKNSLMSIPILFGNIFKDRTFSFFSLQLNKRSNAELLKSSQSVSRPWGALM